MQKTKFADWTQTQSPDEQCCGHGTLVPPYFYSVALSCRSTNCQCPALLPMVHQIKGCLREVSSFSKMPKITMLLFFKYMLVFLAHSPSTPPVCLIKKDESSVIEKGRTGHVVLFD